MVVLVVLGTRGPLHLVLGGAPALALAVLQQGALVVGEVIVGQEAIETGHHGPVEKVVGGPIPRVQVDGTDHGFEGVGQDAFPVATTALLLAAGQAHVVAHPDFAGNLGQDARGHHQAFDLRKLPLVLVGSAAVEMVGHHQIQHRVSEEFQALVGSDQRKAVPVDPGPVRQGVLQEPDVGEDMPQGPLQRPQGVPDPGDPAPEPAEGSHSERSSGARRI